MKDELELIGFFALIVLPSVIGAYSSLRNGRALKNGVTTRMHSPSSALCPRCYHVFKIDRDLSK